ncbi:MAG: C1 family peptidase [Bacteroidales bacterium]
MILKKTLLTLLSISMAFTSMNAQKKDKKDAQEPQGYVFTTVKEAPITSIKNQSSSSTCWAFSSISFLESEAIKKGASKDLDLSEMFVVSKAYSDKAEKYLRVDGALNFAPGSSFGDVIYVLKNYGAVPDSEMDGLKYGENRHMHGELDAVTSAYVNALLKKPLRKLSTAWHTGFDGILAAYLGNIPQKFTVAGKEYTPKTYVESLNINPDDYVSVTSFTHHPFYSQFVLEVPDNWRWDLSYNLPLDDFIKVIDNAINEGYTIAWASDVSEKGFTRNGVGIVPDANATEKAGSDQERWIGKSKEEKDAILNNINAPGKELQITQEMRQKGFDEGTTTDDHGMHIFGVAKDQNGTKYYMVKNSWGDSSKYKGIWYVSEPYVRYKTTNIVINKNAIPQDIRTKLNIK